MSNLATDRAKTHALRTDDHPAAKLKRLYIRIAAAALIGIVLPLTAMTVYFHFKINATIKESSKLVLAAFSQSLGNTIDLFLEERILNLFSLFHRSDFTVRPSNAEMKSYLEQLTKVSAAFIDLQYLDSRGDVLASAGTALAYPGPICNDKDPYALMGRNSKAYAVSDFCRNTKSRSFVVIAVRRILDDRAYAFRSLIDLDSLNAALQKIRHGDLIEFGLRDHNGNFWSGRPEPGWLEEVIDDIQPWDGSATVIETPKNGELLLTARTGLDLAPWTLLVLRNAGAANSDLYRANKITTASLLIILFGVSAVLVFLTHRYIRFSQESDEKKAELRHQLIHASKLASVGELATGIAHEINNPLAIITSTSGVIRDRLDPEFDLDSSPKAILSEIDTIESAAFRARGITRQLLDFGRKHEPQKIPCDLNELLAEIAGGLKQKEFNVANIELIMNLQPDLPNALVDPDQTRQVFLNLVNNAGDAISGPGRITITTRSDDRHVVVTIEDTGEGMTPEELEKIFDPFFTTKEVGKGTGLGLSISLSIIEAVGGRIDVDSQKGHGSTFTLTFPISELDQS